MLVTFGKKHIQPDLVCYVIQTLKISNTAYFIFQTIFKSEKLNKIIAATTQLNQTSSTAGF